MTVAHEYTHALQQAHFDIGGLRDSLEANDDRRLALRALIEGDALLSELLYMLSYFDERKQAEVQSNRGGDDLSAFYAAPVFIQNTITFPYSGGYQFAVNLYLKRDDFSHIDLAYETLPASTEQILHPDKYDTEKSRSRCPFPTLRYIGRRLGRTGQERNGRVVPAVVFRERPESRNRGQGAAAGWGGDEFLMLETPDGDDGARHLQRMDTEADATEFADTLMAYGEAVSGQEWVEVADVAGSAFRPGVRREGFDSHWGRRAGSACNNRAGYGNGRFPLHGAGLAAPAGRVRSADDMATSTDSGGN